MNATRLAASLAVGATFALAAVPVVAFAAPAAPAATPAAVVSGTGTLTVDLTQPVVAHGSATASMTCASSTATKLYRVRVSGVTVGGATVSASATLGGYAGPGTYQAVVTTSVAKGTKVYAGAVSPVTLAITATGGTATFDRTAPGHLFPKLAGATIAGTLTWTCPSAA